MTNEAIDKFIALINSCNKQGTTGHWLISLEELGKKLERLRKPEKASNR